LELLRVKSDGTTFDEILRNRPAKASGHIYGSFSYIPQSGIGECEDMKAWRRGERERQKNVAVGICRSTLIDHLNP
jgi:hypothetical protein